MAPADPAAVAERGGTGRWLTGAVAERRAGRRVREILSTHYPEYIDPAVDRKVRDTFPILLPREHMRPGNTRW